MPAAHLDLYQILKLQEEQKKALEEATSSDKKKIEKMLKKAVTKIQDKKTTTLEQKENYELAQKILASPPHLAKYNEIKALDEKEETRGQTLYSILGIDPTAEEFKKKKKDEIKFDSDKFKSSLKTKYNELKEKGRFDSKTLDLAYGILSNNDNRKLYNRLIVTPQVEPQKQQSQSAVNSEVSTKKETSEKKPQQKQETESTNSKKSDFDPKLVQASAQVFMQAAALKQKQDEEAKQKEEAEIKKSVMSQSADVIQKSAQALQQAAAIQKQRKEEKAAAEQAAAEKQQQSQSPRSFEGRNPHALSMFLQPQIFHIFYGYEEREVAQEVSKDAKSYSNILIVPSIVISWEPFRTSINTKVKQANENKEKNQREATIADVKNDNADNKHILQITCAFQLSFSFSTFIPQEVGSDSRVTQVVGGDLVMQFTQSFSFSSVAPRQRFRLEEAPTPTPTANSVDHEEARTGLKSR